MAQERMTAMSSLGGARRMPIPISTIFTSSYFGTGICDILDDTQYLDCALPVNAAPTAFTPPIGKGPLWFIPSQTVTLMDQVTRYMGTYFVDANGFIIPQFNGGEDLTLAWAKQLGRNDCASVLQKTLDEERATDKKLTTLAESKINLRAAS
jgi:hypothetical protein